MVILCTFMMVSESQRMVCQTVHVQSVTWLVQMRIWVITYTAV